MHLQGGSAEDDLAHADIPDITAACADILAGVLSCMPSWQQLHGEPTKDKQRPKIHQCGVPGMHGAKSSPAAAAVPIAPAQLLGPGSITGPALPDMAPHAAPGSQAQHLLQQPLIQQQQHQELAYGSARPVQGMQHMQQLPSHQQGQAMVFAGPMQGIQQTQARSVWFQAASGAAQTPLQHQQEQPPMPQQGMSSLAAQTQGMQRAQPDEASQAPAAKAAKLPGEEHPRCRQLMEAYQAFPNAQTKTVLAVLHEYATRLGLEVSGLKLVVSSGNLQMCWKPAPV